jgi:hypothetical protein
MSTSFVLQFSAVPLCHSLEDTHVERFAPVAATVLPPHLLAEAVMDLMYVHRQASSRVWIGPDKVELDPANHKSYMSSVDEFVKSKMHNMAVWLWVQSEPSILMNEPF